MRKCPNCNAVVEDDSLFCANCGEKLPQVENEVPSSDSGKRCPNCNAVIDEDSVFCVNCGHKLKQDDNSEPTPQSGKRCPNCNAVIDEDSVFCANCGFKLKNGNNYTPIDEETKEEKSKWWLYALIGVIVVVIAGGGLYYWTQSTSSESFVAETAPTDSIKPDVKENAEIDSEETKKKRRDELVAQVEQRVNKMLNDVLHGEGGEGDDDDFAHVCYFSKSFKTLYDKVDENLEEGMIGHFDYDFWTQSQGDGPTRFEIKNIDVVSETSAVVNVLYIYDYTTSSGGYSEKQVKLNLVYENGNWFMDDFLSRVDESEEYFSEKEGMEADINDR